MATTGTVVKKLVFPNRAISPVLTRKDVFLFFFACGFSFLYLTACANLAGDFHKCRLEAEKMRPVIRGTIPETDPLSTLEDDLSSGYRAHLRLTFLLSFFSGHH